MPNLFGLNIAALVNQNIAAAGGVLPGTLTRSTAGTRTSGSLAGGVNATDTTFSFRGFAETKADKRGGSSVSTFGSTVTILGASISTIPAVGDEVLLDGVTYRLQELISRDPAAAAYEFGASEV